MSGKLLQIAQLGQPVLRQRARSVRKIDDKDIQVLIDNLVATVMDVDGVGIAAPQVYEPKRLFIMASHPNPRYPKAPNMEPTAVINPRIIKHSSKKIKDWEGCLSLPGIRGLVPRWGWVEAEYQDRKGKVVKTQYEGFLARIFQHEYDHLEGVVFLDRVETTKEVVMEKEYQRIISSKK